VAALCVGTGVVIVGSAALPEAAAGTAAAAEYPALAALVTKALVQESRREWRGGVRKGCSGVGRGFLWAWGSAW